MKKFFFITVLMCLFGTPDPWQTSPQYGARRDAYGPGIHMDATGRPYRDHTDDGGIVMEPVQPNAYGPGIDMDATGRPVTPRYNDGWER